MFAAHRRGSSKKKISEEDSVTTVIEESLVSQDQEIIRLTQELITSITTADYETYTKLVDPHVTAFEPESQGCLIEGLEFHKFYFDNFHGKPPTHTTLLTPQVISLGPKAACISYVRLDQVIQPNGEPVTRHAEETRIWQRKNGNWVNVHFHRSVFGN